MVGTLRNVHAEEKAQILRNPQAKQEKTGASQEIGLKDSREESADTSVYTGREKDYSDDFHIVCQVNEGVSQVNRRHSNLDRD